MLAYRNLESKVGGIGFYDIRIPELKPGQALIKIYYAALNYREYRIKTGNYHLNFSYGNTLGGDGAGVVEAVSNPADGFWVGKPVIINPNMGWGKNVDTASDEYRILGMPGDGTFAEYISVDVDRLMEKPEFLSFAEAAALPLAGLTAYRAIFTKAGIKAGEKVLITGIGGGVALFALQFAVACGATVYVTSGEVDKIDFARTMGATAGVIYKDMNWDKELRLNVSGFDAIIDCAGGNQFNNLVQLCNAGGRLIFYGATKGNIQNFDLASVYYKQLTLIGTLTGNDSEFCAMVDLVNRYSIRPVIDSIFAFTDIDRAFAKLATHSQLGKIVLKMQS